MGSLTLDKPLVEFIKNYLENHRIERMKDGKDNSIISVVREALFIWAEQKGLTQELEKHLKQKE